MLNRVLGGGSSQLNGALYANGQVYLINQNGVVVGPNGRINAAGFTASTRDLTDPNFLKGHLKFTGRTGGSVVNLGKIKSTLGEVVLIGKTVDNQGNIVSPGTTGLVAGDSVIVGQKNADGSIISVSPSRLGPNPASGIGVNNSGSIQSASAELKAANGNIYSLAIQNSGTIRATSYTKQGGHIWLTAGSGTIENSGTLNVSAKAADGKGGSVVIKDARGTAIDSGKIIAQGGEGGSGGKAEVSGNILILLGEVNLTASGGKTGTLLFDPENVTIQTATGSPLVPLSGGIFNPAADDSIITVSSLESALASANITVSTGTTGSQSGDITLANALNWSSANSLTLAAANNIYLNADVTAVSGGLILNAGKGIATGSEANSGTITANINLSSFILQGGAWIQNAALLPTFTTALDFELQNASSSFLRVAGGNGTMTSPFQITDVYGLQGIGSPSSGFLGSSFVLDNDVSAATSKSWNGANGFNPIGGEGLEFGGTFDGNGYNIDGLPMYHSSEAGLFGQAGSTALIENVGLTNVEISGGFICGSLVGENFGTLKNDYSTGSLTCGDVAGGLVGQNASGAKIQNCYSSTHINLDGDQVGGLVGLNTGSVQSSYSTGLIMAAPGSEKVGGLVGDNENGTISNSFSTVSVTEPSAYEIGGFAGYNSGGTIQNCYSTGTISASLQCTGVGGFIGYNASQIQNCYSTGAVNGTYDEGGFVGYNQGGTILNSYSTGLVATAGGGFCFSNTGGQLTNCFWVQQTGFNQGLYGIYLSQSDVGATPETFANLKLQSTFSGWDFTDTWTTNNGASYPVLKSVALNVTGTTAGASDMVDFINSGALDYSTSAVGGTYDLYLPADMANSGTLITDATGNAANVYYVSQFVPTAPVTLNLTPNSLSVQGTGSASNTALGTALGGLTNVGANFSASSASGLVTGSGIDLSISIPYALDSNITTSGNITTSPAASLTGSSPVTIAAANITLGGSINDSAEVTFNTPGTINSYSSINVGGFILTNGNWQQIAGQNGLTALPTFTDSGDFELQNASSFMRAAGGTGTSLNPYQLVDVYGLQGIGSPSSTYNSSQYILNNLIDASGTSAWNPAGQEHGFVPISNFSGSLNGNGYAISGLITYLVDNTPVALFPTLPSTSQIDNLSLTNGQVQGSGDLGALVGINYGTLESDSSSDSVTLRGSGSIVGGLVGLNEGPIIGCSTSGAVNSNYENYSTGGLVGSNPGTVQDCSSSAVVTGGMYVGGLVGGGSQFTSGSITSSFATGNVSALLQDAGGLVGLNNGGNITNCYASGNVIGGKNVGGLIGESDFTVVSGSHASGSAIAGAGTGSYVGGLIGVQTAGSATNCYSSGLVQGSVDAGGLIGQSGSDGVTGCYSSSNVMGSSLYQTTDLGGLIGDDFGSNVRNSYATGNVTSSAKSDGAGGLIGYDLQSSVTSSFSTGLVTTGSPQGNSVSGFIGSTDSSATAQLITNCFWLQDGDANSALYGVNGSSNLGATPETLAQLKQQSTYGSAFDFTLGTGAWGVNGYTSQGSVNNGLPFLQAFIPVAASVTAINQTATYNGTPTGDGFSSTAFTTAYAPGYDATSLASTPTLSLVGTNKNVGSQNAIVPTALPNSSDVIELISGVESFAARPITVAANTKSSTYGNVPLNPGVVITSGTLGSGDSIASAEIGDNFNLSALSSAGNYVISPLNTSAFSNYSITPVSANFAISPRPVTLSANTISSTYGITPPFSTSVLGVVNGDFLGTISYSTRAGLSGSGHYNTGTYNYSPLVSGLNPNYTLLASNPGTFTVTPAPITLSGINFSTIYGNTPAFSNSVTGLINGDSLGSISYIVGDGLSGSGHYNVGTYNYSPSVSGLNPNYSIKGSNPGSFTITPAPVILSGLNTAVTVYGTAPAFSNSVAGLVSGDSLGSIGYVIGDALSSSGHYNAGTYNYSPVISGLNPNYTIQASNPASFTISPAPVTLSGVNLSPTIYGNAPPFTYTSSGVLAGDQLDGIVNYVVFDGVSASGNYNAGPHSYGPGLVQYNPNYSVNVVNLANFSVTPQTLVYNANGASTVAKQPFPSLSGYVSGFLPGDSLSNSTTGTLQFVTFANLSTSPGSYPIYGTGLSSTNYVFTQAPSNLTALVIAPIPLFDPALHDTEYDNAYYSAFDYAYAYAQQNAEFNAQENAWLAAFEAKKAAAILNARYAAYRYEYFGN